MRDPDRDGCGNLSGIRWQGDLMPDKHRRRNGRMQIDSPRLAALCCCLIAFSSLPGAWGAIHAQAPGFAEPVQQAAAGQNPSSARDELATGTSLTRDGKLTEAIPHLLAARAAGAD